ncbi:MAG TPA: PAS domain S-box protein [Vicinamibacterales bacterium]
MANAGRTEAAESLFAGRSDIASRCRAIDWSATPLGPVDRWPEDIRAVIRACLGAPTIPMAIWVGSERVLLYNEGCVPLLGSTRHPWALGQPARGVWPESWERLGPMLERVIEHGESIQCTDETFWLARRCGDDAFYACSLAPIRNARGEVVGALGVLQETTERVRSTSQQKALLDYALVTLRAGAWAFDLDTGHVFRSAEHDRIFGHEGLLPTWTYRTFAEHVLPEDREHVDRTFRRAFQAGKDWSVECRIRRADGELRRIWVSGRWVDEAMQRRRRMSGIVQDITERKRTEEALRISEARLKFAQDAAGAGIWHWDLATDQWHWSDQLYHLFGWDPKTAPPVTVDRWRAALHPEDRERAEANLMRALTHGTPVANEDRIVLPTGEIRWVNALGRTAYDTEGKPLSVSGICIDITERKRAEQSLRISEEKFAKAFHGSTAAMTLTTVEDGRLLEVNDRFAEMTGFRREEALGKTTAELGIWKDPADQAQFVGALRRDGSVRGEYAFVRPDGRAWTGVVSAQLLQLAGKPTGISSIIDITARKEAEEALRASEAVARQRLVELEAIYETAPVGLCVFDEKLRWVRLNQVIADINGRAIEDHIGRTPSEIVPDVGGQAEDALRTVLRTGERLDFEMRGTTAAQPGVERVWSERWAPMKDPEGRIVGISVAAEEITERKRAAEALAASEERYRTLAENAPEAIARFDGETRYTYINEYGARMLSLRPQDVIGRTLPEIVTDAASAAFWQKHFDEVTASAEHRTVDSEFESPVFGHQFLSTLLVPERSTPSSLLVITRDITPLKQIEDALRKSEAALREANRHKNEFLAWLSHELRNPLNVISVNLSLIQQAGLESEQAARALPRLVRQVRLIGRLLDDLLDVTRISKGKIRLQPERVALGELVQAIGEDHRETFDHHGIRFEIRVPKEPVHAEVDSARIAQIVGNLLQNAAKFTPSKGHVSLMLIRAAEDQAIIEVRDDGAGIRPELLGRLFEPLVQDERMIARSQGGLGLGLALVKGLVELHGGTVRAASDGPDRGSVFRVCLPTFA